MTKIELKEVQENFPEMLANEWMLITAGDTKKFNTMTASWGGIGYLWNKPVVFVFVRPERYTYEFMEAGDSFTLAFLGQENQASHKICGSKSGRDIDKVAAAGLLPEETPSGNITFKQSRLTFECRTLYTDMIRKENFQKESLFSKWYGDKGSPHKMYVAEITNCWISD